jgi:hypothetical protein
MSVQRLLSASRVLRTGGLKFDGVDDYVEVPTAFDLLNHTVILWMKPSPGLPAGAVILWNYGGDNYWMRVNVDGYLFGVYSSRWTTVGWHRSNAPFTIYIDKWVQIAETWDGNHIKLYVNGVLDKQIPNTYVGTGYFFDYVPTRIGWASGLQPFFKGLIGEVRIYNQVLSQDGIIRICNYNEFIKDGLVLCLDFTEGEGNIAYDKSGLGNHGTIYGAEWVVKKAKRVLSI